QQAYKGPGRRRQRAGFRDTVSKAPQIDPRSVPADIRRRPLVAARLPQPQAPATARVPPLQLAPKQHARAPHAMRAHRADQPALRVPRKRPEHGDLQGLVQAGGQKLPAAVQRQRLRRVRLHERLYSVVAAVQKGARGQELALACVCQAAVDIGVLAARPEGRHAELCREEPRKGQAGPGRAAVEGQGQGCGPAGRHAVVYYQRHLQRNVHPQCVGQSV
ncbi:hypothetical protein IWW51_006789, partial [Coemansia sp. RSA 2702]